MFADRFPRQLAALKAAYDAMGHAYHNWDHIQALLAQFHRHRERVHHPESIELAIYYHDVIYVPGSKTNEADSAEQMRTEMTGLVSDVTLDRAVSLVLATASHDVLPSTEDFAFDCALLLDMDLSILGADPEAFDAYDRAIRSEFAAIPWEIYRPARRSILQGFLGRDWLYLTSVFRASHEAQARSNLSRLVDQLSS